MGLRGSASLTLANVGHLCFVTRTTVRAWENPAQNISAVSGRKEGQAEAAKGPSVSLFLPMSLA